MQTEHLTLIVCPQGDTWVAQCVEFDIAAQAKTVEDVIYEFERTLQVQMAMDRELGREPLSDVPPAPDHFRTMARGAFKIDPELSPPRFRSVGTVKNRLRHLLPTTELRLANSLCPT
jgi:hypothetical protein